MATTVKIAVAALCGAAVGGFAMHGLHAQTKPPVYQISLQDVSNSEALNKEFVPIARPTIARNGGKVLAGAAPVMLEGSAPAQRVVVNVWPSMEQAKVWWDSPEYKKARAIGNKYAKFTVFLVEGLPVP